MRLEEARYVGEVACRMAPNLSGPVLNLGSSTEAYRTKVDANIENYIFAPLDALGVETVHADLKDAPGVDISGSLFDRDVQGELRRIEPTFIMLCNLLEHLEPDQFARVPTILGRIAPPGAVVLVTVPHSFPIHFDPIDNYYRPTPEELIALFPDFVPLERSLIRSTTYLQDLRIKDWQGVVRDMVRLLIPVYRPKGWLAGVHKLRWLFTPYEVSCVVFKNPPEQGALAGGERAGRTR